MLKLALRRIRRSYGFSLFAAGTLAVAIGSTTALYSVAQAVLFGPSDIADVSRVVNLYHSQPPRALHEIAFSAPDVADIRAAQTVFSDVMAWAPFRDDMREASGTQSVAGECVSSNYFDFVGARMLRGRGFLPKDEEPSAEGVAVISERMWRLEFAGDQEIVGRSVGLGGNTFRIVGVADGKFRGVNAPTVAPTKLWVPLKAAEGLGSTRISAAKLWLDRETRWILLKGRLRDGRSLDDAATEIRRIGNHLDSAFPMGGNGGRVGPGSSPQHSRRFFVSAASDVKVHESVDFMAVPFATGILWAVGLVLLAACTNLANVLLAHGARDRRDVAVCMALGAGRARLITARALEATILSLVGGAAGLLLAVALMRLLSFEFVVVPGLTLSTSPTLSWYAVSVAGFATAFAVLVFACVPAVISTNVPLRDAFSAESNSVLPRWRSRRAVIVAQVCLSTGLLVIGGNIARGLVESYWHDPGFQSQRLTAAQIDFARSEFDALQLRTLLLNTIRDVAATSGAEAAACVSRLPTYWTGSPSVYAAISSQPVGGESVAGLGGAVNVLSGTALFPDVLGIRLQSGREFSDDEVSKSAPVAMLTSMAARRVFGDGLALGRAVFVGAEPYTVVGITGDIDSGTIGTRDRGFIFLPLRVASRGTAVVVTSSRGAGNAEALRKTLATVAPSVRVSEVLTGREIVSRQTALSRIAGGIVLGLGGVAFVLAVVGVVGLLSYMVAARHREIGLRMALGATVDRIVIVVLRQGLRPVIYGITLGLCWSLPASYGLSLLIPSFEPSWAATATVPFLLVMSAAVACYAPALRATRIEPSAALRVD